MDSKDNNTAVSVSNVAASAPAASASTATATATANDNGMGVASTTEDSNSYSSNNIPRNNNNKEQLNLLPAHLNMLLPGNTQFNEGEEKFRETLITMLSPFGINRLVVGSGSHKNKNEETKKMFPRHRFVLLCGACNDKKDDDTLGCCGFKIRMLLVHPNNGSRPYLEVKEFILPSNSKHLLVSQQAREESASKVINNEDMLTPKKVKMLKSMGVCRANEHTVKTAMSTQFEGVKISTSLMHRVMKKGRDEAWGADDEESMLIFYMEGIKLLEFDKRYGVAGTFQTTTCPETGKLLSWSEQMPIEVLNAWAYGIDAYWVDTTHNATRFGFKTGPTSVPDWGGLVAPSGIFQVPEEETEAMKTRLIGLELDTPGATSCTDGGAAWPAIVEEFKQKQVEDTWHNDKNAEEKAKSGLSRQNKKLFKEMKYKALYGVFFQTPRKCEVKQWQC